MNQYIEILELKKRVVWSYDEGDNFLVKKHIYGNSFTTQMMSLKQENNHIQFQIITLIKIMTY